MVFFFLILLGSMAMAQWNLAESNSTASFRGIHNAGKGIIWASGTNGTVLRSEDDGYMWQQCSVPPDAQKLDFRGVFGWDADHASVMSIGTGAASRLYETTDGCATWHLLFENPDRDGFWDALLFHGKGGFILGDPVKGRFVLFRSDDSGKHWQRDDGSGLAAAPEGEGVFAASNSSLVVLPNSQLLFATGGVGGPHVFRRDKDGNWSNTKVPINGGTESAGAFSIAFRDNSHGIAVGGDYKNPAQSDRTAAWTSDGGVTWHSATRFPSGFRSAVAWDQSIQAWIAAGPNGSDASRDDGRTWRQLDSGNWNALSLPWAAGPKGRIASLDFNAPSRK
ncbi:MAG TPA: hypothetical protein VFA65_13190 [Bryobacteraceae bacterium]|nr:hypothetical protein [Bryobacteraceae bacterium]